MSNEIRISEIAYKSDRNVVGEKNKEISVPLRISFSRDNIKLLLDSLKLDHQDKEKLLSSIAADSSYLLGVRDDISTRDSVKKLFMAAITDIALEIGAFNNAIAADAKARRSGSLNPVAFDDMTVIVAMPDFTNAITQQTESYKQNKVDADMNCRFLPFPYSEDSKNYIIQYNDTILKYNKDLMNQLKGLGSDGIKYFSAEKYWEENNKNNIDDAPSYIGTNLFTEEHKTMKFKALLDEGNIVYNSFGTYRNGGKDTNIEITFNAKIKESLSTNNLLLNAENKSINYYSAESEDVEKMIDRVCPEYFKRVLESKDDFAIGAYRKSPTVKLHIPKIDGKDRDEYIKSDYKNVLENQHDYLSMLFKRDNPLLAGEVDEDTKVALAHTVRDLYKDKKDAVRRIGSYRALLGWYFNSDCEFLKKRVENNEIETLLTYNETPLHRHIWVDSWIPSYGESGAGTYATDIKRNIDTLKKFNTSYSLKAASMSNEVYFEGETVNFNFFANKANDVLNKIKNEFEYELEPNKLAEAAIAKAEDRFFDTTLMVDNKYENRSIKYIEEIEKTLENMQEIWKDNLNPETIDNYEKNVKEVVADLKSLRNYKIRYLEGETERRSLEAKNKPVEYPNSERCLKDAEALSSKLDELAQHFGEFENWENLKASALANMVREKNEYGAEFPIYNHERFRDAKLVKKIKNKIEELEHRADAIQLLIDEYAPQYCATSAKRTVFNIIFGVTEKKYEISDSKQYLLYVVGFKCVYLSLPLCPHDPTVNMIFAPILALMDFDVTQLGGVSIGSSIPIIPLLTLPALALGGYAFYDLSKTRKVILYKWVLDTKGDFDGVDPYKGTWVLETEFEAGNYYQALSVDRLFLEIKNLPVVDDAAVKERLDTKNNYASMEWTGGFFCGAPSTPFDNSVTDYSGEGDDANEILIDKYKYKGTLKSSSQGFLLSTCTKSVKQLRSKGSEAKGIIDDFIRYFINGGTKFAPYRFKKDFTKDNLIGKGDDVSNSSRPTHEYAHPFVICWSNKFVGKPGLYDSENGEPFCVYAQYIGSDVSRLEFYICSNVDENGNPLNSMSAAIWTKIYQTSYNRDMDNVFLFELLPQDDKVANAIRSFKIFETMKFKLGSVEFEFDKKWFMYVAASNKADEEKDLFDDDTYKVKDFDDFIKFYLLSNVNLENKPQELVELLQKNTIDYTCQISVKTNQVIKFYAVYSVVAKYTVKFLEYSSSKLSPILSQTMDGGSLIVPSGYKMNQTMSYKFTGNWLSLDDEGVGRTLSKFIKNNNIIDDTNPKNVSNRLSSDISASSSEREVDNSIDEKDAVKVDNSVDKHVSDAVDTSWIDNASSQVLELITKTSTLSDVVENVTSFTNNTIVEKNITFLPVYDIIPYVTFHVFNFANKVWTTLGGTIQYTYDDYVFFPNDDGNYKSVVDSTGSDLFVFTGKWAVDIDLKSYGSICLNYNPTTASGKLPDNVEILTIDKESSCFFDSDGNAVKATRPTMDLYALYQGSGITLQYYVYDFDNKKWVEACNSMNLDPQTTDWNVIKGISDSDITAGVKMKGLKDDKAYVSCSDIWWVPSEDSPVEVDDVTLLTLDNTNEEARVGLTDSLTYKLPDTFSEKLVRVYKLYKPAAIVSFYVYEKGKNSDTGEIFYKWKKYIEDAIYNAHESVVFPDMTSDDGARYVEKKNTDTSFKYEMLTDRLWADVVELTDDITASLLSAGENRFTSCIIDDELTSKTFYAQYREKNAITFMVYDFEEENWVPSSEPIYVPQGTPVKDFPQISTISPGLIDGVDYGFDTNWYSTNPDDEGSPDDVNEICLNSADAPEGTIISPYVDDFEGVNADTPLVFYAVYKPKPVVRFMYYFSARGTTSGSPGWYQLNKDAVSSVGDTVYARSETGQTANNLTVGYRFRIKWYKTGEELSDEELLAKFLAYGANSDFYSQDDVVVLDGEEYTVSEGDGRVYLYALYDPGIRINYHYFASIDDTGVGTPELLKAEDVVDEGYSLISYNAQNSAGDALPLGYSFVGWKYLEGDANDSFLTSLVNPESTFLSTLVGGLTLLSSIVDIDSRGGEELHFYASYKKLLSVVVYACNLADDSSLYTIAKESVAYGDVFTLPSPQADGPYFRGIFTGEVTGANVGSIYTANGIYYKLIPSDDDSENYDMLRSVMFSSIQQEDIPDSEKVDCSTESQAVTITGDTYFYLLYTEKNKVPVSFEYLTYTYNGLSEGTGLPDEITSWNNILNVDEHGDTPQFNVDENAFPIDLEGNTLLSIGDDGVGIYTNAKYEFTGYWYRASAEELADDTQLEQIRRRCEINDFEESELVKFDEENKSYLVTEADVESGNEIRFIAVYKRKVTVLFYGYDYTTSTWGTVPNYEAVPAYFFPGEKVMPFPVINSTSASEMNGGEYHGNNYEHSNLWYEYIPSSESSPEFNGYIENGLTADDENVRDPNTDEGVVLPSPDTSGGVVIYYALYTKTIYVKFMVYRFDEEGNLGWQPYSSTVRMKPTLGSLSLIEDLARISEDGLDILVNQSVTDADGVSHDVPDRRYTFKKRWFRYDVESDDADSENNAAYAEADTLLDSNELIAGDSEGSTYFSLDNVWSAHIERNTIFYACYDVDYAFVPRYYIFDVARDEDDKEMAIYSCVNEPVGSDVWDETIYFTQHRDEGSDSDADSVPWCSELDNEDDASWKNFLLETERAADILSMKYATYWHMCADPTNPHKLISTTEVHGGRIEDDEYVKSLTDIKTAFNVNSDGIIEDENVLKNNNLVRFYAEDGSKIPVVLSDKFFDGTEYRHPTTKMRVVSFFATYNRVPAMGVEFMVYDFEEKKWVALKVPGKDGEMKDYAIHSVGDKIYVPNTSTMHSQYYDVAPTYPAVSDDSEEWVDEFDEYDDSGTLISSRVLGKKSPSKYISENSSIYEGNMDAGRNVLFHSRQQWVFGLPEGTPEAEIIHDLCFNNSYYLEDNLNHSIFEGKAAVCTQSVMGNKVTFTRHMSKGEKDGYTDISLKIGDDEVVVEEGKTYRFYALYYIYFNVANIYDTRETPGVPVVARPQNVVDQHPVGSRENNLSRSHMASTVLLRSPLMAASEIKTKLHVYDGVRIRTNYGSPHKFAAVKGLDASTYDPSEYDEVSTYPSFDEYLSYRGEDLYKQEFDFTKIQTSFGKNGKHTLYVWLGEKRRIGTGGDEIWIMVQRMTVQFKNDFEAEGRIDAEY